MHAWSTVRVERRGEERGLISSSIGYNCGLLIAVISIYILTDTCGRTIESWVRKSGLVDVVVVVLEWLGQEAVTVCGWFYCV